MLGGYALSIAEFIERLGVLAPDLDDTDHPTVKSFPSATPAKGIVGH